MMPHAWQPQHSRTHASCSVSQGDAFKKHLPRVQDYLWVAEDGMKMQGTRTLASMHGWAQPRE
jgi:hypothetical protein